MAQLVINAAKAEAESRLVVLRLAALTLRLRENWIQLFGDLDTASIALAIASIQGDRLLRENQLCPEGRNLSIPLPEHLYGGCNIASIAVAAGLNRETARRKILKLEAAGIVVRDGQDVRLSAHLRQRGELIDVVRRQLDAFRRVADDLLRDGVIEHRTTE